MRIILLLIMAVALGSCTGHETLKAPCDPIAGIAGSPCSRSPVNMADL
jgi:hypothetical protein